MALAMPFAPYYIQDLGITDPVQVKLWTTVITACTPLAMAVFSPIWGILSDRHGRKPMVLRATCGAGSIMTLAAFAPNAYVFVFLRIMQGIFSGVASSVITLVACNTPQSRQGLALGSLGSAQFSGNMFGLFIGGFMANKFGYANSFMISGVVLFSTSLLVMLFVKEEFVREATVKSRERPSWSQRLDALGPGTVLLLLVLCMSITRRMDGGLLAIYIQELYGSLDGVALWSGFINASGSFGALFAGLAGSLLIDRFHPRRLLYINSGGAALAMCLIGMSGSYVALIPLRFLLMIFLAGFDPILNTWLSKVTPSAKKGVVFGLAQAAKSTGMTIGPCIGGLLAWQINTRSVFFTASVMFLTLIPLARKITAKLEAPRR